MSIKMDNLDEMNLWFTLVNKGLGIKTVEFYQELADINGKASSLYYLLEAAETFKEYLSQAEDEEEDYFMWNKEEIFH